MSELKSTIKNKDIPYSLPSNWKWYNWGDIIITYQQGLIRSNDQLGDEGFEYFKMNNINEDGTYSFNKLPKTNASIDEICRFKIKEGDFFINVRNSKDLVGKSCVIGKVDKTILFNHMLIRINHINTVSNFFIHAYLNIQSSKKLIERCKKGTTTVIALYQADLYKIPIALPDVYVQDSIANIYKSIIDKIELNNRINAELEAMAKTLYDYWFVQFDFPDSNGKPYKSSGGKMVYNEKLKRKLPEGWDVDKIGRWIVSDKSGDWGKEQEEGNYTLKVSCIRGADINGLNGKGDLNPPERYILEKNKSKCLNPYDLIVEISGGSPTQSTGRMAYITQETLERFENPLICSNFCKAISLKDEKYIYNFAFLWNMLYDNKVFFGYEGKTSGIKNFLFDSFINSYWSIIPKKDIVLRFYSLMKGIENKKQKLLAENQRLASLRDWLLPMLMNGQVGFKEDHKEQAQTVGAAAEANAEYKPSASQNDNYHKIQSVYAVLWANSLIGVKQGEMATAKDLYLVDRIAGINTGFTYVQHNWGSFDPAFKKTINNTQYFTKRNFPNSRAYYCDTADNGYLLAKIPEGTKDKIKSSIEELHNKIFINYFGKQKAEMKELYATVLKCIEDTQNTTLAVIRQVMEDWKTPKQNFPNKAAKFSIEQTKEVLDKIIKEGWAKNVIKNER